VDLFDQLKPEYEDITEGVCLLPNFADTTSLMGLINGLLEDAPLRNLITPGGKKMAVAMSNCGSLGWYSDKQGYRYTENDPLSATPWPNMPIEFKELAYLAALKAGSPDFDPDACLINQYATGIKLSPHIDHDEADKSWPIVSVSIGVPAIFQLYGNERGGKPTNIPVKDGDVIVFGGPARHYYHGVKKIELNTHPLTGPFRYNLTFRKAT
jgi:alkylated DNA repair protein (DNA oxidative demethylase)